MGKVSFYISSPCRQCSSPSQVSQSTARHRLYIYYCEFSGQSFSDAKLALRAYCAVMGRPYFSERAPDSPVPPQGANWQKVTVLSQSKYMSVLSQCIGAIFTCVNIEMNQSENSTKCRRTGLAPRIKNRNTFTVETIHEAILPTHLAAYQDATEYK